MAPIDHVQVAREHEATRMRANSLPVNAGLPPVRSPLLLFAAVLLAVFAGSLLVADGRFSTGTVVLGVFAGLLLGAAMVAGRRRALAYRIGGAVAVMGLLAGLASMVMLPMQLAEGRAEIPTMARAATGFASLVFGVLVLWRLRRRQRSRPGFGPLAPIAWR